MAEKSPARLAVTLDDLRVGCFVWGISAAPVLVSGFPRWGGSDVVKTLDLKRHKIPEYALNIDEGKEEILNL